MPTFRGEATRFTPVVVVVVLTLAGAGLRMHSLFSAALHADEALFATWARLIGTWSDPLLRMEALDKPPLFFYVQALFFPLLGSAEPWVARIPNLAASIVLIPLTARFVWTLFDDTLAALLAATIVSLSPLLVRYGATAFIDPLLCTLIFGSLQMVARSAEKKPPRKLFRSYLFAGGLLMGLAISAKHQALIFIPLQLTLIWLLGHGRREWRAWFLGVALSMGALFAWLLVRGVNVNLWAHQMNQFGGLRAAWSWEIWSRLESWAGVWQGLLGTPVLGFGLLLFLPIFLALLIQQQDRSTALDHLLVLFVLSYSTLHWLLAIPIWDRYVVAVAPFVAVVLGRFVSRVASFFEPAAPALVRWSMPIVILVVALLMAPAAVQASDENGQDLGGRAAASAAAIANTLQEAPYGTVLYDHWYSWQWRYFLMHSRIYVNWFAHPTMLAEDLDVFLDGSDERYLVLPRDESARLVRRTLWSRGYTTELVIATSDMILYRIGP